MRYQVMNSSKLTCPSLFASIALNNASSFERLALIPSAIARPTISSSSRDPLLSLSNPSKASLSCGLLGFNFLVVVGFQIRVSPRTTTRGFGVWGLGFGVWGLGFGVW